MNGQATENTDINDADRMHVTASAADTNGTDSFETADGYTISEDDPLFKQFRDAFKKYGQDVKDDEEEKVIQPEVLFDGDNVQDEEEEEQTMQRLSKKARKQARQMTIAQLKALVSRPELVEWTDVNAPDPVMLVAIKANLNVVPVPGHWTVKREFLSAKRGIEKAPFALPTFIADTGIGDNRDADLQKRANMSLKAKQRERVQGKTGKLDIDYQKLHDAFFRHQTKPGLTRYGEAYYEGKEWETNLKHLRPGRVSEDLKDALGMAPGGPPPWLLNMQRVGAPPSYPGLNMPGLNGPIPAGSNWGYQAGGWGKPPVDEFNRPMFDPNAAPEEKAKNLEPEKPKEPKVDTSLWGELAPAPDVEEELERADETDEGEDEEDEDMEDADNSSAAAGARRASKGSFVFGSSGAPTPAAGEFVGELGDDKWVPRPHHRHGRPVEPEPEPEQPAGRRSLYTVVKEDAGRSGEGFLGSSKKYDIKGAEKAFHAPILGQDDARGTKRKAVDVSVDVDALERNEKITQEEIRRQYQQAAQEQKPKNAWSEWGEMDQPLDDMIQEEMQKRSQKDEERNKRRKTNRR